MVITLHKSERTFHPLSLLCLSKTTRRAEYYVQELQLEGNVGVLKTSIPKGIGLKRYELHEKTPGTKNESGCTGANTPER
jgi:hypothetical protein